MCNNVYMLQVSAIDSTALLSPPRGGGGERGEWGGEGCGGVLCLYGDGLSVRLGL